jgi:hypothetical protein
MVASLEKAIRDKVDCSNGLETSFQMGSTRLEISKDPKGVYPKMPVQLFQEEGFKKTNLRQLLFSKL